MKKTKVLISSLCAIAGSIGVALPITSCSCGTDTPVIDGPIPESEMVFDVSKGVKILTGFKQPWSAYAGYTEIRIPSDVLSIADGACESTADNMMPNSIKTIRFDDSASNAEIIPLIIGKRAFANATSVKKFIFPKRLKYVCEEAFAGCVFANTIDITSWISDEITEKSFPFADTNIFQGWPAIGKVEYSDKIDNFVANLYFMFTGAGLSEKWIDADFEDGTKDHPDDKTYTAVKYKQHHNDTGEDVYRYVINGVKDEAELPKEGKFVIPAWADALAPHCLGRFNSDAKELTVEVGEEGSNLQTIYHNAFANATNLRKVDLSNATLLKTIGTMAFYAANLSEGLTFSSSLKSSSLASIGSYAFQNSRLTKLDLSNTNVNTISIGAFKGCLLLTDVTFPDNKIEEIDPYAFDRCEYLENISNYKDSLKWIGNNAFSYCNHINSFNFGNKLEFIGECAFQKCTLGEVEIPASVWSIGDGAFSDNYIETSGTRNITIESIKVNNENQYYKDDNGNALCSKNNPTLLAISNKIEEIPEDIVTIGAYALSNGMWDGEKLDISQASGLKTIRRNAFSWFKRSDTDHPNVSLILPTSVESIEDEAFYGSSTIIDNLSGLTNLKHIGEGVFSSNLNLEEVEIPSGITAIPARTFYDDIKLKEITIPNTVREIGSRAFDKVGYTFVIDIDVKSFTTVPNWTGEYAFGKEARDNNVVLHIANANLEQQWRDLFDKLKLTFKEGVAKLDVTTE